MISYREIRDVDVWQGWESWMADKVWIVEVKVGPCPVQLSGWSSVEAMSKIQGSHGVLRRLGRGREHRVVAGFRGCRQRQRSGQRAGLRKERAMPCSLAPGMGAGCSGLVAAYIGHCSETANGLALAPAALRRGMFMRPLGFNLGKLAPPPPAQISGHPPFHWPGRDLQSADL